MVQTDTLIMIQYLYFLDLIKLMIRVYLIRKNLYYEVKIYHDRKWISYFLDIGPFGVVAAGKLVDQAYIVNESKFRILATEVSFIIRM